MPILAYNYNQQMSPQAPFVYVTISNTDFSESEDIPGLIDTGADRTLIPNEIISKLNFKVNSEILLTGFSRSEVTSWKTHLAHLGIRGAELIEIEVVGMSGETYAILGRDFLNHYKITLDGPNLTLNIDADPPQ